MDEVVEQFFQWKLVNNGEWETKINQEILLSRTVCSQLNLSCPVHPEFSLRFCKQVMKLLEASGEEVNDQLYDCLQRDLLSPRDGRFFKSYFVGDLAISLIETKQIISSGTTGLNTWTAGIHLSRWMAGLPDNWGQDQTILELGAGTGMTGIFALKRFPGLKEYILTDSHSGVLDNMKENLSVNLAAEVNYQVENLDWEMDEVGFSPDIVLGADIVFDTRIIPDLVRTLAKLLERGAKAIIASTIRREETYEFFLKELDCKSLTWTNLEFECQEPVKIIKIEKIRYKL